VTATVAPHELRRERFLEQVMGLPVTLAVRGADAHTARSHAAWQAVMAELTRVDQLFSTYRHDSVVSRIGRRELAPEDGPHELAEVLELADAARQATDGAFDVWQVPVEAGRVFDPSGVVKGWALQRAAGYLTDLADSGWCLNGGGDMVCSAGPAGFPAWRVGIEDPSDPRRVVQVVELTDGAIATSGAAQRGDHIRDARDGRPPEGVASVSVLADTLTRADIEATCGFLRGAGALGWLRSRPIRGAVVVGADGALTTFGEVRATSA
jgi:thiamine biosynthesis lipoprotein